MCLEASLLGDPTSCGLDNTISIYSMETQWQMLSVCAVLNTMLTCLLNALNTPRGNCCYFHWQKRALTFGEKDHFFLQVTELGVELGFKARVLKSLCLNRQDRLDKHQDLPGLLSQPPPQTTSPLLKKGRPFLALLPSPGSHGNLSKLTEATMKLPSPPGTLVHPIGRTHLLS